MVSALIRGRCQDLSSQIPAGATLPCKQVHYKVGDLVVDYGSSVIQALTHPDTAATGFVTFPKLQPLSLLYNGSNNATFSQRIVVRIKGRCI